MELMKREWIQKLSKYLPQVWSLMIIHLSFIRNMWISATPSATVTLLFTYLHTLTLLTSNSLLSRMIALPASVIQLSLTYPHVPDEVQMNNHQASYLVSICLIFVFTLLDISGFSKRVFINGQFAGIRVLTLVTIWVWGV